MRWVCRYDVLHKTVTHWCEAYECAEAVRLQVLLLWAVASTYGGPDDSLSGRGGVAGSTRLFEGAGGGYVGCGATPSGYAALAGGRVNERGVLKVHLQKGVGLKAADPGLLVEEDRVEARRMPADLCWI